jgi:8-oxo-dGTP pyrophosphatase MutT (NUDIX family)
MTSDTPTLRIAAALLHDDAGRVLLVRKRGSGKFMQPGGKLEPGETPEAALLRELLEELGLRADPATLTPLGRFSALAANEPGHIVVADIFALRASAPVVPAAEIEEAVWVTPEEAKMLDLATLSRDHVLPLFSP